MKRPFLTTFKVILQDGSAQPSLMRWRVWRLRRWWFWLCYLNVNRIEPLSLSVTFSFIWMVISNSFSPVSNEGGNFTKLPWMQMVLEKKGEKQRSQKVPCLQMLRFLWISRWFRGIRWRKWQMTRRSSKKSRKKGKLTRSPMMGRLWQV